MSFAVLGKTQKKKSQWAAEPLASGNFACKNVSKRSMQDTEVPLEAACRLTIGALIFTLIFFPSTSNNVGDYSLASGLMKTISKASLTWCVILTGRRDKLPEASSVPLLSF